MAYKEAVGRSEPVICANHMSFLNANIDNTSYHKMDRVCVCVRERKREEHLRQQSEPIRLRCERVVTFNALEAHLRSQSAPRLLLRPGADSD